MPIHGSCRVLRPQPKPVRPSQLLTLVDIPMASLSRVALHDHWLSRIGFCRKDFFDVEIIRIVVSILYSGFSP